MSRMSEPWDIFQRGLQSGTRPREGSVLITANQKETSHLSPLTSDTQDSLWEAQDIWLYWRRLPSPFSAFSVFVPCLWIRKNLQLVFQHHAMFLPPGPYLELLSWLPSVNCGLPYVSQVNPSKPQVAFHCSLYSSNRKLRLQLMLVSN